MHQNPWWEESFRFLLRRWLTYGDMDVGFKVQLVVEFYIYCPYPKNQTQKMSKTPEQAHLERSSPLLHLAALS